MPIPDDSSFLPSLRLPHDDKNTLQILVVADMDLRSASSFAEYALSSSVDLQGGAIDMICACGPFCNPTLDLKPYLSSSRAQVVSRENVVLMKALEGLVTASLSQLESIVCRVVWIPFPGEDPPVESSLRLTPNSRNVHAQWLPLAPGLAVSGIVMEDERKEPVSDTVNKLFKLSPNAEPNCRDKIPTKSAILLTTSTASTSSSSSQPTIESDDRIALHIHKNSSSNSEEAEAAYFENKVLSPGSLKRNGEYSLVTLGLESLGLESSNDKNDDACYKWTVVNVELLQFPVSK